MENFELNTPILYLVFNRLEATKKSFGAIKKVRPKQLFVGADGPRFPEEKKKTDAVRDFILKNIDWECDVKTLFREKNLGCKIACAGTLDWFFNNVEEGIILEDDCLPSESFFRFCQEMLEKYRDNKKVVSINAVSTVSIKKKYSYNFAKNIRLWGWASWKRAWNNIYRKEEKYMNQSDPNKYIKEIFPNFIERTLFQKRFLDSMNNKVNTWEFPWVFGIIRYGGLNIVPKINLMENIGIEEGYTNTSPNFIDKRFLTLRRGELEFPLNHPHKINLDKSLHRKLILRDLSRIILKKVFT